MLQVSLRDHESTMAFRALITLILLTLSIATAHASIREVDPGETVRLDADEGLLAIRVDSDSALAALRIQRNGSLSASLLKDIKPGIRSQLYAVSAGDYHFDHLSINSQGNWQFKLADDARLRFTVKAGVVNYPGDLVFRSAGGLQATIELLNHGLRAIDWIAAVHPSMRSVPFAYCGAFPDPFPEFYAARAQGHDPAPAEDATSPTSAKTPFDAELLWQAGRIRRMRINGAGDLIAELAKDKDVWSVNLINLAQSATVQLIRTEGEITSLDWKGDRTLLVGVDTGDHRRSLRAVLIRDADVAHPQAEMVALPRPGFVIDTLPADPSAILFASFSSSARLLVHRVDVGSRQSIVGADLSENHRLNKGVTGDTTWFADCGGRLRAGVATHDGEAVVLYGSEGNYREVKFPGAPGAFVPIGLAPEGDLIYALWDGDRTQRDLVTFDPVAGSIRSTLFSHPGADVEAGLFDRQKKLVGATYYRDGNLVSEYFDADRGRINDRVARTFPGESVILIDHDDARRHLILGVESAARPMSFFHLDSAKNQASPLDDSYPWLAGRTWAATKTVHAVGADRLPIEAYLTLAPTEPGKPRPLVVLTHGGPIGVRDTVDFDPEVQYIASLGYAVLQVNYRGSEGYGRAFREAGRGQFGTSIEDDIAAAVDAALAAYPLDGQRICAVGSSYGGYSSLISAIRWPDRFRCVVSIMGLTDLPLFFTASDSGRSVTGQEALIKLLGDPRQNVETLMKASPLYRYKELRTPLLLIHGSADPRVDYEHSRRLARMLALDGRPPQLIEVKDAGHGFITAEQRRQVWPAVTSFLQQYLGSP
jgi:dipeptidyl aminopeptidase/acylaminoacyl peptidase